MTKKTLYEFSVSEAESKLKTFIKEDESGEIEVKIINELPPLYVGSDHEIHPITKLMITDDRLKLLTTVKLASTDGNQTICKAEDTFKSYIDSDFKNWDLDKKQKPTKAKEVCVCELIKDLAIKEIFTGDLDSLVMTQSQIIEFCNNHAQHLRQEGYTTLFLMKENDEYFVVSVVVCSDGLNASVSRFGGAGVYGAGLLHRVVVPQLIS